MSGRKNMRYLNQKQKDIFVVSWPMQFWRTQKCSKGKTIKKLEQKLIQEHSQYAIQARLYLTSFFQDMSLVWLWWRHQSKTNFSKKFWQTPTSMLTLVFPWLPISELDWGAKCSLVKWTSQIVRLKLGEVISNHTSRNAIANDFI